MNHLKSFTHCIILMMLSLSCAFAQDIFGNGNVVKQTRDITAFTSINATDGWDLILTQGDEYSLVIETDENLVDQVKTEVSNGVLNIYSDANIRNSRKRNIHLTFTALHGIKASGGCDIEAETLISSEKFELDLSGGSDVDALRLSAGELTARFSGGSDAEIFFQSIQRVDIHATDGSDIELRDISGTYCRIILDNGSDALLSGKTDQLILTAANGSDVEAYNFEATNGQLELSGASDGEITVVGTLDLTLRGGSDLACRGNPQIRNHDICKSCDLELR